MNSTVQLIEHYFRHEYGRLVALLTSHLGVRHLEVAEDAVQSALSRALVTWPRTGTPANPSAWLYRAAKNLAIDVLRKQKWDQNLRDVAIAKLEELPSNSASSLPRFDGEIGDETLRLLFLCCHPAITPDSQVALALKTVSGFGVHEIAHGLLTTASNIEKRLTRAKEKLREHQLELVELKTTEVVERCEAVLSTIYLIFNEGYSATTGDLPVRHDLCFEAIRLAKMVAEHPVCSCPAVHALVALLLLHTARFDGRLDTDGSILLLAQQDRSRWDAGAIREAMAHAQQAASGTDLSRYHIEVGIAWEHCRAQDFATTDWSRIAQLYSLLQDGYSTPMIRLNAAVATSYVAGPDAGRDLLLKMEAAERKRLRPWWDCCMAQLNERRSDPQAALSHWRDALALATAEPQRQLIQNQIDRLIAR